MSKRELKEELPKGEVDTRASVAAYAALAKRRGITQIKPVKKPEK